MNLLNNTNYPEHIRPESAKKFNRDQIKPAILHFGVGNFHRCHQAVYCDDLINQGNLNWGIVGVSLRSTAIRDALAPQDFLYTQATLGEVTNYRVISSLTNILVAPETPDLVVLKVADEQTQVVTITITEKGYCLTGGDIDVTHVDFNQDLKSLSTPKSIYGFLAAGIIKRMKNGDHALTVMCCDNMQGGGEHLEHGVKLLLAQHHLTSCEWAKNNVSFISSMVDRVSPATDQKLKDKIAKDLSYVDQWPVSAEPFSQWIIADNFAGEKPPFDQVGAVFVEDIAPFENMKLRFLNAGHSIAAALGYLKGEQYIHQALAHSEILNFVKQTLLNNVLPVCKIPAQQNGQVYIEDVITRFQNSALPYAVLQVGTDSSQKIQQRLFPSIDDALAQNSDSKFLAFSLAAWGVYIVKALTAGQLSDPLKDKFAKCIDLPPDGMMIALLTLAQAEQFEFFNQHRFMSSVTQYYFAITNKGLSAALAEFT